MDRQIDIYLIFQVYFLFSPGAKQRAPRLNSRLRLKSRPKFWSPGPWEEQDNIKETQDTKGSEERRMSLYKYIYEKHEIIQAKDAREEE